MNFDLFADIASPVPTIEAWKALLEQELEYLRSQDISTHWSVYIYIEERPE